jgi:HSP20 family protein
MICKMLWKGAKNATAMMFTMADGISLIDAESIQTNKMKSIFGSGYLAAIKSNGAEKTAKKLRAEIKEFDETLVVTVEVPGIEKEDIDISATEEYLYINARRINEAVEEGKDQYDLFSGTFRLPCSVKTDRGKASYHNGLLIITLSKDIVTTRTKISID